MTRGKPRNLTASVHDRLLDLARKQKEDFQLLLTRYCLERLLYHVSRLGPRLLCHFAKRFKVFEGLCLSQSSPMDRHMMTGADASSRCW
jgi:hypothetical protein